MGIMRVFRATWASVVASLPKRPAEHPALVRAREALRWQDVSLTKGHAVTYGMGFGGKDPLDPHPFEWDPDTKAWRCDCSGMVAWCHGFTRHYYVRAPGDKVASADYWRNTDGLEADARGTVPGDLGDNVRYGEERDGDVWVTGLGRKVGHCGIRSTKGRVIHCHSGRPTVVETSDKWFRDKVANILRIR